MQASVAVGTPANLWPIPGVPTLIQNMGPGNLYLDFDSTPNVATAFRVPVGAVICVTPNADLYAMATDNNCELRMISNATSFEK